MIKFLDLHKINEQYRPEIDDVVKDVLDSGWYIMGSKLQEFENGLLEKALNKFEFISFT